MRLTAIFMLAVTAACGSGQGQALHEGSSPQLAMDAGGTIRVIFGRADTVFSATSRDQGATFDTPVVVGVVHEMHLGATRGPVVASSRTRSMVAATDKSGNTHLFELDHRTNHWQRKPWMLNSVSGSAPEGLGTLAADDADTFYSVWLDYREAKKMYIYFARMDTGTTAAPENRNIYASPDGHVCECCRPALAIAGKNVAVMFRNWLGGNRDMYLLTSNDQARTFGNATKLGTGSWKLDACPMDGGALAVDANGRISTVWRRELAVYVATPGAPEKQIGTGRNPMLSSRGATTHIVWVDGNRIKLQTLPASTESIVGDGRLPSVLTTTDGHALVAWERDGRVYTRRM